MKQRTTKSIALKTPFFFLSLAFLLPGLVVFCSFKTAGFGDGFLKTLGLTKESADERITSGLLGGYVNAYGIKNAKALALGDRKTVVLDLLSYTKEQVSSAAFSKRYNDLRMQYKPKENIAPTPEQDRATSIANAKDAVTKMEEAQRKSGPQYKAMFDDAVKSAKEALKKEEDPANKSQALYARNYPELVKSYKESYARQTADWEKKYPANPLLFVKVRLLEFMEATKDVDFNAELTTKSNGKKYFVNPAYEHKSNNWKMAFRAGREVVEPAREFVQKWIAEIK